MNLLTVLCSGIGGLAALLILLNWVGFIGFLVARSREPARGGYSFAPPFICGPVLAAAWALCPGLALRPYAWLAILMDPSILFSSLALVLGWLRA